MVGNHSVFDAQRLSSVQSDDRLHWNSEDSPLNVLSLETEVWLWTSEDSWFSGNSSIHVSSETCCEIDSHEHIGRFNLSCSDLLILSFRYCVVSALSDVLSHCHFHVPCEVSSKFSSCSACDWFFPELHSLLIDSRTVTTHNSTLLLLEFLSHLHIPADRICLGKTRWIEGQKMEMKEGNL